MSIKNDNLKKLQDHLKNIKLTEEERKTIEWLAGCEPETADNLCSIIKKL